VNIAALTFSRLAMSHFTQSAFTNDIVSQLESGHRLRRPGAWARRGSTCKAIPAWATVCRNSDARLGTTIEGRDSLIAAGRTVSIGGSFRR